MMQEAVVAGPVNTRRELALTDSVYFAITVGSEIPPPR
jgi:hypothetical protein